MLPTPGQDHDGPGRAEHDRRRWDGDRQERSGRPRRGLTRRRVLAPVLLAGLVAGTGRAGATPFPSGSAAEHGAEPAIGAGGAAGPNSFLLRGVRLFDGERVRDRASVLVLGGVIAAVADGRSRLAAPPGVRVYDGSGRTLLPGLIDAHVHTDEGFRADALRFGVTTELDMFGDPAQLADAKPQRRSLRRTDRADLWSAGIGVTVPGGHPQVPGWEFPRLRSDADAAEVDRFVGDRFREGSDYLKLIVDDAHGRLPTLTPTQVRAAVRAAHRRGRLAVAHAERLPHIRPVVDGGVDGLVHVAIDGEMDGALVAAVRRSGAFVVPTVTVVDCGSSAEDLLADPRIRPFLSAAQAYTLRQRNPRGCRSEFRRNVIANIWLLHRAGVPVLAGTDAPLYGTVNGPSLLTALGYLVEAGLSPQEALASATSVTARSFGFADRGRILPGLRADLLLVDGSVMRDITALRGIAAVWKNGFLVDRRAAR